MHAVPTTFHRHDTTCAAGHRTSVVTSVDLVARFVAAASIFTLGVRSFTSLLMLPVAWSLVSIATVIVVATLIQHAKHSAGECVDCEHESQTRAALATLTR